MIGGLTDTQLLADQRLIGELRRVLDTRVAEVAGEIGYRSRRELGQSGLAQAQGVRTPAELVTRLTGVSARDAGTLVQVGAMVRDAVTASAGAESTDTAEVWMTPAGLAVAGGRLSIDAARAIRGGIGRPVTETADDGTVSGITAELLAAEVTRLVAAAGDYPVDELAAQARQARDDIDEGGIVARERLAQDQRSVREIRREGMPSKWLVIPDFETDALMKSVRNTIMGPRTGGPRFVSSDNAAWAQSVVDDPRTNDQYLHDGLFEVLRVGLVDTTDPIRNRIVGPRKPAVRVLVAATARDRIPGDSAGRVPVAHGFIEGSDIPVSLATVERIACADGVHSVELDSSARPLDLGRERRWFSDRQRTALALFWGGCAMCGKPPSWCEAHHITDWRDGGETNLQDGVLLCRFCHLMLHNRGWKVAREHSTYWLIPPASVDPDRTPRRLDRRSPALRQYRARLAAQQGGPTNAILPRARAWGRAECRCVA